MPKARRLSVCRDCEGQPAPAWSLRPCKRCAGSGLDRKQSAYLRWIRTLTCARCGNGGYIEAHHERACSSGAYGQKEPDHQAAPLCRPCHERRTRGEGRVAFWGLDCDPANLWLDDLFAVLRRCYEGNHAVTFLPATGGARAVVLERGQAREGCDIELRRLLDDHNDRRQPPISVEL